MQRSLEKHFRPLVAIPILLMASLQIASVAGESSTFDECIHLAAGYRYWLTGIFSMNIEHPPLPGLLSSMPLLLVRPPLPMAREEKSLTYQMEYAKAFLYGGPIHADRILFLARIPTIALTIMLAVAVAWTTRHFFGVPAALASTWLCALDPNLIAHGRYITTDMASTLFFFVTPVLWVSYLRTPSRRRAMLVAFVLGLAFCAKFSMVILPPVLLAMLLVHGLLTRPSWEAARRGLLAFILLNLAAAGVVGLVYARDSWGIWHGQDIGVDPRLIPSVALPFRHFATGLNWALTHSQVGQDSYLLGTLSTEGWWYYFPAVLAVKSPIALLLLIFSAAAIGFWRVPRLVRDPVGSFLWVAFLLPVLIYFGVVLTRKLNIGIRHVLPMIPFLYVLGAAALSRVLAARAFLVFQAAETVSVFPEYLPFFNMAAGGPRAGHKYLLDSNVDWGQDLKKLKTYVDKHVPGRLCLEYFGSAEPGYYGIQYEGLPKTGERDLLERMDCIGAISANRLHDLYITPGSYEWLRKREPVGVVGSSIFIYDLRRAKRPLTHPF